MIPLKAKHYAAVVSVVLVGAGLGGGCPEGAIDPGSDAAQPAIVPGSAALVVYTEGQGTVKPGLGFHELDTQIDVTATPAAGWRFDHWEGDLAGGPYDHWRDSELSPANPATLLMDADKSIRAVFKLRQTATETFDLGGGVTLTVVEVSGGTFTMGSSQQEQTQFAVSGVTFAGESPQRDVTVSTFAIGETEVTQAQFEAVMGYVPNVPDGCETDCVQMPVDPNLPATWVSWVEAAAFCDALSEISGRLCRLPTEAEWEYACRAGAATAFAFGDDEAELADYAWYNANSEDPDSGGMTVHAVALKLPNAWGLYDMHGNAWEWVGDWYAPYSADQQTNPTGPAAAESVSNHKILRGGAYQRFPWALRSAYRYEVAFRTDINSRAQFNFGFRIVCE